VQYPEDRTCTAGGCPNAASAAAISASAAAAAAACSAAAAARAAASAASMRATPFGPRSCAHLERSRLRSSPTCATSTCRHQETSVLFAPTVSIMRRGGRRRGTSEGGTFLWCTDAAGAGPRPLASPGPAGKYQSQKKMEVYKRVEQMRTCFGGAAGPWSSLACATRICVGDASGGSPCVCQKGRAQRRGQQQWLRWIRPVSPARAGKVPACRSWTGKPSYAGKRACRSSLAATRAESGPPSGSTLRSIERSSSTAALIRSA